MSQETYFLGSSTPSGFVSAIEPLLNDTSITTYILKGTAGSGKSTLMKKISQAFADSPQEIYRCSADPDSLDAVYIKDKQAFIMDGTAPHCADPKYPIAVQSIIDLGEYLESSRLRANKEKIISMTDEYGGFHRRCRLCLSAISSVVTDIISAASEAVDREKLSAFTVRTSKRLIPKKAGGGVGKKLSRQLSAVTMNGYSTYIPEKSRIYLLSDSSIAGSDIFLRDIADTIIKKGYDVIISECLICSEKFFEHLIVPELDIAFITSNCLNGIRLDSPKKVINFRRFYSKEILTSQPGIRQRIRFGKKAAAELIKEASSALTEAKQLHDRIEEFYIDAADFDALNRLSYKLISEIRSLN